MGHTQRQGIQGAQAGVGQKRRQEGRQDTWHGIGRRQSVSSTEAGVRQQLQNGAVNRGQGDMQIGMQVVKHCAVHEGRRLDECCLLVRLSMATRPAAAAARTPSSSGACSSASLSRGRSSIQLLLALASLAAAAASREAFSPRFAMALMRTALGCGAVPNIASTWRQGHRGEAAAHVR